MQVRWAGGATEKGLPIRRLHCFLPGFRRSLCKKRFATDNLTDGPVAGIPVCVACARQAESRDIELPSLRERNVPAVKASEVPPAWAGLQPGEHGWRVLTGMRMEHAFVHGLGRSQCGRYSVWVSSSPSVGGEQCVPCARRVAGRPGSPVSGTP